MSSSLSKVRSIALSYGIFVHPTPTTYHEPAHVLGSKIIHHLWEFWGSDNCGLKNNEIDLYSVNIPLIEPLLSEEGLKIYWTTMWRTGYERLFKNISSNRSGKTPKVDPAGPDSSTSSVEPAKNAAPTESDLVFVWSPMIESLVLPDHASVTEGSDGWALQNGAASVTPLRASFAEPVGEVHEFANVEDRIWKVKL